MLLHYMKDNERPFTPVLWTNEIIIVRYEGSYFRVKEWACVGNKSIGGYKAGYNVDLSPLDAAELEKYREAINNDIEYTSINQPKSVEVCNMKSTESLISKASIETVGN